MDAPSKFEIHYYLSDESHSMSALIRNRCEAEFIAVVLEASEILGIKLDLECEALREGGIREVWKALGDNSTQIALLISTLALVWSFIPHTDQELIDLQKEDLRLSIEQRKKELEKVNEDIKNEEVTIETVNAAKNLVYESHKVVTRKSNFYKALSNYEKVTKVGFSELSASDIRLSSEMIVPRQDFTKVIVTSHELKPLKDSSAFIEIVAPVLKEGRSKWKGVYKGESISFSMNDNEFKNSVISKELSFKNGDGILCVLFIHKKIDELGEIITSGYSVEVVLENKQGVLSKETNQGRSYRHTKKMVDGQGDMFMEDKA